MKGELNPVFVFEMRQWRRRTLMPFLVVVPFFYIAPCLLASLLSEPWGEWWLTQFPLPTVFYPWLLAGRGLEGICWLAVLLKQMAQFLLPFFVAWSFAREFEEERLPHVLTTLLTPRQIALGKLMVPIVPWALFSIPLLLFGSLVTLAGGDLRTFYATHKSLCPDSGAPWAHIIFIAFTALAPPVSCAVIASLSFCAAAFVRLVASGSPQRYIHAVAAAYALTFFLDADLGWLTLGLGVALMQHLPSLHWLLLACGAFYVLAGLALAHLAFQLGCDRLAKI